MSRSRRRPARGLRSRRALFLSALSYAVVAVAVTALSFKLPVLWYLAIALPAATVAVVYLVATIVLRDGLRRGGMLWFGQLAILAGFAVLATGSANYTPVTETANVSVTSTVPVSTGDGRDMSNVLAIAPDGTELNGTVTEPTDDGITIYRRTDLLPDDRRAGWTITAPSYRSTSWVLPDSVGNVKDQVRFILTGEKELNPAIPAPQYRSWGLFTVLGGLALSIAGIAVNLRGRRPSDKNRSEKKAPAAPAPVAPEPVAVRPEPVEADPVPMSRRAMREAAERKG